MQKDDDNNGNDNEDLNLQQLQVLLQSLNDKPDDETLRRLYVGAAFNFLVKCRHLPSFIMHWCKYGQHCQALLVNLYILTSSSSSSNSKDEEKKLVEFLEMSNEALRSCRDCVETYYRLKSSFPDSIKSIYKKIGGHSISWTRLQMNIEKIDIQRLSETFNAYLTVKNAKDSRLIFALFEALCWPQWIWHPNVRSLFSQTISLLLTTKKMLKVSEPLPGVLACLLHSDPNIAQWSKQAIESAKLLFSEEASTLALSGNPLPRLVFSSVTNSENNSSSRDLYLQNVLLLVNAISPGKLKAFPAFSTFVAVYQQSAIMICLKWIYRHLIDDSARLYEMLCVFLSEFKASGEFQGDLKTCRRDFFESFSVDSWNDIEVSVGWLAYWLKCLLSSNPECKYSVVKLLLEPKYQHITCSLAGFVAILAIDDQIALQVLKCNVKFAFSFQECLAKYLSKDHTIDIIVKSQFNCMIQLMTLFLHHQFPLDNALMVNILKTGVLSLSTSVNFLHDLMNVATYDKYEQLASVPFFQGLARRCLVKSMELEKLSTMDQSELLEPFIINLSIENARLVRAAFMIIPQLFCKALRKLQRKAPEFVEHFIEWVWCSEDFPFDKLDKSIKVEIGDIASQVTSLPSVIVQVMLSDLNDGEKRNYFKSYLVCQQNIITDECLDHLNYMLDLARSKLGLMPISSPPSKVVEESPLTMAHMQLDFAASSTVSKIKQMKAELMASKRRPRPPSLLTDPKHPSVKPRVAHSMTMNKSEDEEEEEDDSLRDTRQSLSEAAARHAQNAQLAPRSVKLIDLPTKLSSTLATSSRSTSIIAAKQRDHHGNIKLFHKFVVNLSWSSLTEESVERNPAAHCKIPTKFSTHLDYEKTFEPLLKLETTAQLVADRLESMNDTSSVRCKVTSAIAIDNDFYEVSLNNILTVSGQDEDPRKWFGEHDVLRIDQSSSPFDNQNNGTVLSLLGVTSTVTTNNVVVRVSKQLIPDIWLREGQTWKVTVFSNVVTSMREYLALKFLGTFEPRMQGVLLNTEASLHEEPNIPISTTTTSIIPSSFMNDGHLRTGDLNESQVEAVKIALMPNQTCTLIQGPPGTGKTKTIECLVSNLLSSPSYISEDNGILVCAPSNAAVDELCSRLMNISTKMDKDRVTVVRIGNPDVMAEHVKSVLLDHLVDLHLNTFKKQRLEAERALDQYTRQTNGDGEVVKKVDPTLVQGDEKQQQQERRNKINTLKDNIRKSAKQLEDAKTTLRTQILRTADIVCCTLSGSGHDALIRLERPFATVIVDEACQAVELSTLIPLQHSARKLICVGDPQQLPPTVLSQARSYEVSLFQRLASSGWPVHLLSVQYRMHPDISRFPSQYFYQGRLIDAPGLDVLTAAPWHKVGSLGPFRFFDVPNGQEMSPHGRSSLYNDAEAKVVVKLVERLMSVVPPNYSWTDNSTITSTSSSNMNDGTGNNSSNSRIGTSGTSKIAIITPYNEQKRRLRHEFAKAQISPSIVHISTVDGFQGQERSVVIFSCVRTGGGGGNNGSRSSGLGFVTDARRINVALTRAKSSLWIVGKAEALRRNNLWRNLVEDAERRNLIVRFPL